MLLSEAFHLDFTQFDCFLETNMCLSALLIPSEGGRRINTSTLFIQNHNTRVHSTMKTLSSAVVPLHPAAHQSLLVNSRTKDVGQLTTREEDRRESQINPRTEPALSNLKSRHTT